MPARKSKAEPDKITVKPAKEMLAQPFRLHVQTRHPMMRYRSRGEHEKDHRLHGPDLDHIHATTAKEEDEREPDQGTDLK